MQDENNKQVMIITPFIVVLPLSCSNWILEPKHLIKDLKIIIFYFTCNLCIFYVTSHILIIEMATIWRFIYLQFSITKYFIAKFYYNLHMSDLGY